MKNQISLFLLFLLLLAACEKDDENSNNQTTEFLTATVNGNAGSFTANEATIYAQYFSDSSGIVIRGDEGNTGITLTIGNNFFNGVGNYDGVTLTYSVGLTGFSNNANANGYSKLNVTYFDGEVIEGNFEFSAFHHNSSNSYLITEGAFRAKVN